MPITRMPDGTFVDIGPNATPQQIAEIRARHTPRAGGAPSPARAAAPRPAAPPVSAQEARTEAYRAQIAGRRDRRAIEDAMAARNPVRGAFNAVSRNVVDGFQNLTHEASLHLDDVVSAAGTAATAPDVWAGRRSIGDEFSAAREGMRRARGDMQERSPIGNTVGGLYGMVRGSPGALLAKAGERVAPRLTADIAGRLATRPIRSAAIEGAMSAGVTSLADTGDIGRAGQAALVGGGIGGVAGGVLGHLVPGAQRAFQDRAPDQASRVAYDKIATMLTRGRDEAGNVLTPQAATAEIADATARGTPTTLGDLTPEMQGLRGEFARRTNLPSQGDVALEAEQRLASAADRFDNELQMRTRSQNSGTDAVQSATAITRARKADAAADYAKGGALDRPLAPTPVILNAMARQTPDMRDALKAARRAFQNDPSMGPFMAQVKAGKGVVEVPTTRAFDEIKKAFDDIIEAGIKYMPDGSPVVSNASRAASKQIRALKDAVAKANPDYAAVVGRQRDAFERLESLNVGKEFLKRMSGQARELLTDIKKREVGTADELRTGVVDALLSLRNTRSSPIKLLRQWERNPQQRAVLVHIMGGQRNFNEFSKFMRRELRAMQADATTLRKSNSPVLNDFVENGEDAATSFNPVAVLRGQAFGGPMGAVAAGVRELSHLKNGMGPEAQEQTLRLLQGNGEGLEAGVNSAIAERAARKAAAVERARLAGRLAGRGTAILNGSGE